jgi:hypothetical protein
VTDTIASQSDAFRSLDDASRQAIGNIGDQLNYMASTGNATAEVVNGSFGRIADILEQSGYDAKALRTQLAGAGDSAASFSQQLENIGKGLDPLGNKIAKLGEEEKGVKKLADTTKVLGDNMKVVVLHSERAVSLITQLAKTSLSGAVN